MAARRATPSSARRPRLDRLGDEDHVDVGDVVELVAAALAHRDDREARGVGRLADPGAGDGERASRVAPARSEISAAASSSADVVGEVARGQPQQVAAVLHPQRVDGLLVRQPGDGLVGVRVGADRAQQSPRAGRTPRGGCCPASGRSARATAPGGGARWSASASLAPRTLHSRMAVPSSSATSASIARPAPLRLLVERVDQPQQPASAASGSADAASSSVSGRPASPSRSMPARAAAPSTKPCGRRSRRTSSEHGRAQRTGSIRSRS